MEAVSPWVVHAVAPPCHVARLACRVVPLAVRLVLAARIAVALRVEALRFVRARPVLHAVAHPCRVARLVCHVARLALRPVLAARIAVGRLAEVRAIRLDYPGRGGHLIFRVLRSHQRPVEREVEGQSAGQFVRGQRH